MSRALQAALVAVVAGLTGPAGAEPDTLFWFDGASPRAVVAGCIETLGRADEIGLAPSDYDAASLAARWKALASGAAPSPADIARFDADLSAAFSRLAGDAHQGRVDPRRVGFDIDVGAKRLDLAAVLRSARDGAGGCAAALAAVEPPNEFYRRLVRALARHRALAAAGEPPRVPAPGPDRRKVEPGQSWTGVTALDARLRVLGDLPADAPPPALAPDGTPLYTGVVVEGLKRFQDRHALDPDGVIGRRTIRALDVPLTARVRQIELALERMRWLPPSVDEPVVFVNISLFMLWVLEPGSSTARLSMRVVTGKSAGQETPVFMDRMTHVVFRPYWYPPLGIVRNEILPRARRDPSYLDREDMEIVASGADDAPALPATPENLSLVASGKLTLRQRPGEKNSLGLVKFIFPNANSVYMHGTPTQALFSRTRRDYSHGCIRLEEPARLAEWVLRDDPRWTRERIEEAMKGERPHRVDLKTPLSVIIFYDTVLVDAEGVAHFSDDYYGHDGRLERALARRR